MANTVSLLNQLNNFKPFQGIINGLNQNINQLLKPKNNLIQSNILNNTNIQSNLKTESSVKLDIQANTLNNVTLLGNTLKSQVQGHINGAISLLAKKELIFKENNVVSGKQGDKPVYSNTEKSLYQSATYNKQSNYNVNTNSTFTVTKDVTQQGNKTVTNTNIKGTSTTVSNANTQVSSTVDTKVIVNNFDKQGNLVNTSFNAQKVNTLQNIITSQTINTNSDRNILQKTIVIDTPSNVKHTKTETIDIAKSNSVYNTTNEITTQTNVQKLDINGNIISERDSLQKNISNTVRTIDNTRILEQEINNQVIKNNNGTKTILHNNIEINSLTIDNSKTTGTVQNLDKQGNVLNSREYTNEVNTVTNQNILSKNLVKTENLKEGNNTIINTEIKSKEEGNINTNITYNNNGIVTNRNIDREYTTDIKGELNTVIDANGNRKISLEASKNTNVETKDITKGANGNVTLIKGTSLSETDIKGNLELTNGTPSGQHLGSVIIEFGTYTGIRSSFKMDNGTLKFDFSVDNKNLTSNQTVSSNNGKINETSSLQGTLGEIHFSGEVISNLDEQGNRVFTLKATAREEMIGAKVSNNNGQIGLQVEQTNKEYDISGSLAIKRETITDGNKTITNVSSSANLNVNKVENTNINGINVKTLTPLSASDGLKAGMVLDKNGALSFNFGVFDFKIRFVA